MLYPEDDKENKKLIFVCRRCEHKEPATDYKISRNDVLLSDE